MKKGSIIGAYWANRVLLAVLLGACVLALCAQSAQALPGDLDTSFDQDGFAFAGFGDVGLDFSSASGVAIQSDGKVVVAGSARTTGVNFDQTAFVLARFNVDGTLDTTFGSGGRVRTTFDAFNVAEAIAIQGDKIVVAGFAAPSTAGTSPRSLALARYTSTGGLDPTFGSGGKVTVAIGAGGSVAAMAIQSDGRIVVAGTVVRSGTGADFLLVRFLSGGAVDTSFGTTGFPNLSGSVTTDFGGQERATAVALQSDGKIVVAGVTQLGVDSAFAIARYGSNGLLDRGFGSNGRVTTNFVANDHGGSTGDAALGIALQGDGKIVVVGHAETNTALARTDAALARYNSNGTLDTTFGTGGKVTTAFVAGDTQRNDAAIAVVIQPDGRIVTAGVTGVPFSEVFAVARYNANGGLDTTFGSGGKVTTDRRGHAAVALAIQRVLLEGKIVVAGEGAPASATTRMAVARFQAYPIRLTNVGTFELAPSDSTVAVAQRLNYAFTWTSLEPQTWHDLQFLQLRIREGQDTILSVFFDGASESFSLLNEATGRRGPDVAPGSHQKLETRDATLYMADTSVVASGPPERSVTLNLSLSFKPRAAGRAFVVEVAASDNQGNESGFVEAGTLSVTPAE